MTLHSESLVNAIKSNKADLSINWFAVSTWPENSNDIEALDIDEKYAQKKILVLAALKDSKSPDLAKSFLDLAASDNGRSVFKKYGLAD
ncbi:MAG: substrate-binding domain-containing protein [Desulfobacteraceae bacterium]|nr:substrate-binding domain-containing protein [Desulfobacteraceae bacterium]